MWGKEGISGGGNEKNDRGEDIKDVLRSVGWGGMFVLSVFVFMRVGMWGSGMKYYFEKYVDKGGLFSLVDNIGLVGSEGGS